LGAFLPRLTDVARGTPTIARSAVASTLVAALELCRGAAIGLEQAESFGPIVVHPIGPTVAAAEEALSWSVVT
jgi:chromatin segregation and condensation protein Rec8/ScpA/Scc1 (kleisin family)